MAVLGFIPPIPLPFTPVPITLQNLGVILAGTLLGVRAAAFSRCCCLCCLLSLVCRFWAALEVSERLHRPAAVLCSAGSLRPLLLH
ncbi:biotin transporter BioY [Terrilactibacillus sp. S3-3]|nr:biotin transporter BioY [Terrilactibacillus sp. S3-3]